MVSCKDFTFSIIIELENIWYPKLKNKSFLIDESMDVNPFAKPYNLDIPKGKKRVLCTDCNIKSITIPEGVERLFCRGNNLSKIIIPSSLELIVCNMTDELEQQYKKDMYMIISQKR